MELHEIVAALKGWQRKYKDELTTALHDSLFEEILQRMYLLEELVPAQEGVESTTYWRGVPIKVYTPTKNTCPCTCHKTQDFENCTCACTGSFEEKKARIKSFAPPI